jgi:hypothetical protein
MRKFMNVTLFQPAKKVSLRLLGPAAIAGALVSAAGNAFAGGSDMAALFALVDVSGAQTAVFTVLAAMVAIGLLFFGRRLLRRSGVSI